MKLIKDKIRKYYKYVTITTSWTQPTLSSNGTLGGDSFAVATSDNSNTAYYAINGTGSGWINNNVNSYYIFYNPIPLCVTQITFSGLYAYMSIYIKSFDLYGSNDNNSWTLIQSFSGGTEAAKTYIVNNSNSYKYYKIMATDINYYAAIVDLYITADEQITTIEEATSSDYDFYEDVDVYEAVKENNLYKVVKF